MSDIERCLLKVTNFVPTAPSYCFSDYYKATRNIKSALMYHFEQGLFVFGQNQDRLWVTFQKLVEDKRIGSVLDRFPFKIR